MAIRWTLALILLTVTACTPSADDGDAAWAPFATKIAADVQSIQAAESVRNHSDQALATGSLRLHCHDAESLRKDTRGNVQYQHEQYVRNTCEKAGFALPPVP